MWPPDTYLTWALSFRKRWWWDNNVPERGIIITEDCVQVGLDGADEKRILEALFWLNQSLFPGVLKLWVPPTREMVPPAGWIFPQWKCHLLNTRVALSQFSFLSLRLFHFFLPLLCSQSYQGGNEHQMCINAAKVLKTGRTCDVQDETITHMTRWLVRRTLSQFNNLEDFLIKSRILVIISGSSHVCPIIGCVCTAKMWLCSRFWCSHAHLGWDKPKMLDVQLPNKILHPVILKLQNLKKLWIVFSRNKMTS